MLISAYERDPPSRDSRIPQEGTSYIDLGLEAIAACPAYHKQRTRDTDATHDCRHEGDEFGSNVHATLGDLDSHGAVLDSVVRRGAVCARATHTSALQGHLGTCEREPTSAHHDRSSKTKEAGAYS